VVTAVLASYRGYDTLGETTVIFTAGVGVLALLGLGRRRDRDGDGR
jgi:multicomponent Na+:H+ antiporter subunit B